MYCFRQRLFLYMIITDRANGVVHSSFNRLLEIKFASDSQANFISSSLLKLESRSVNISMSGIGRISFTLIRIGLRSR